MLFEICLLSNWLVFFQTCDIWDLPSSKWNGFCQYFMVLIRNYSVHSWHLNFSPQIASVQTLKWPSAIASRPFESLHWCNFGEKFKCHSCDGTISTKMILNDTDPRQFLNYPTKFRLLAMKETTAGNSPLIRVRGLRPNRLQVRLFLWIILQIIAKVVFYLDFSCLRHSAVANCLQYLYQD